MKNKFLFIVLILVSIQSFSQNILWQNVLGGNDFDEMTILKTTLDSGVILGGSSQSNISGNKTENVFGATDYWIVKLDKTGNIQWQNNIGGNSFDDLVSIVVCNDGSYLIAGNSSSDISGDKTTNAYPGGLPNSDIWILKLSAQGNIIWQKRIGGNDTDGISDMKQTSDHGFILAAYSGSDISGEKTENSFGTLNKSDYWIIKIDSLGIIQWQKTIGGDLSDYPRTILKTLDGGYIVSGNSSSPASGLKLDGAHMWAGQYYDDYWVIKLDSIGNIQWQKIYGGDINENNSSIIQTSDGNYAIAGYSQSDVSFEKTVANKGGTDYWILKIDQLGNILWQKDYGGVDNESGCFLIQNDNGTILVIGGSTSGISGDKTSSSNGLDDIWALNIDSVGNILWQIDIGGSNNDLLYYVSQGLDRSVYIGSSSNTGISGDKTLNTFGDFDYWVIKLEQQESYVYAKAFIDLNTNNLHDLNEPLFLNGSVKMVYDSTTYLSTSSYPRIHIVDTGKVYYDYIPYNPYYTMVKNKDSNVAVLNQIDTFLCALHPIPNINDLGVSIFSLNNLNPGGQTQYFLVVNNFGTTTISNANLKIIKSNSQTFVNATPSPLTSQNDTIIWNLGILPPNIDTIIHLTLYNLPPPSNNLGDTSHIYAHLLNVINDANGNNDEFVYSKVYTQPYDPNNKLDNWAGEIPYYVATNGVYVNYVINFQNTGNDTSYKVVVRDTLSDKLDYNSFEMITASHDYTFNMENGRIQWTFPQINLVDSNTNEPQSHGFIYFKIKTKVGVQNNDIINNVASIYFDYNLPIVTNTSQVKIIDHASLNIEEHLKSEITFYPNPVKNNIHIQHRGTSKMYKAIIKDMNGRKVISTECTDYLNVEQLKPGLYNLELSNFETHVEFKFLKL